MVSTGAIPIVVGVGDVVNRSTEMETALEPMALMLQAISSALVDTSLSPSAAGQLQTAVDSIDVVHTWTWPYDDLPSLLAEKLNIQPRHKYYSEPGGNQPAKLLDDAARRISQGQCQVAVVTGGEALASLSAFANAGKLPPPNWTKIKKDIRSVFSPTTRGLGNDLGATHSIGAPIHVYPLYENALRAHKRQSLKENNEESATLYAQFAAVAAQNQLAWNYGKPAPTAKEIGTVTKKNRVICSPYPLLMNAFNMVNLAAACILTSTEYAVKIGIPQERWIYVLGGAGTQDSAAFWQRPNFDSSPSIKRSINAALRVSGLLKNQIDLFDLYSCFPIVPKLACEYLGFSAINPPKPITLLGGLTSFGGAGNNYSMHAITEMVRKLRRHEGRHGLVLANGGVLTYQHVVCLSSDTRKDGKVYPDKNPLTPTTSDISGPEIDDNPKGAAMIETYTVEFSRDGSAKRGYILGRLKQSGKRFVANHEDENTLRQLSSTSEEQVGKLGWVRGDPHKVGRNLFSFKTNAVL